MATEQVLERDGVDDEIEGLGYQVESNELIDVFGSGDERVYKAGCVLVHGETGERMPMRFGEATLGDTQGTDESLPDLPGSRARIRARREALYWAKRHCRKAQVQAPHTRLFAQMIRKTAQRTGKTFEHIDGVIKRSWLNLTGRRIEHLSDLHPADEDRLANALELYAAHCEYEKGVGHADE